ncbi:hypothetical protein JTL75_31630, partial [Pseudomonas aeruginosa]|nr:hypothetical protein [Pseudomonas aeruginosa]MBN0161231.1 hypothetical protein [Pseudomonas aeruginosa]MBN0223928.1 hypothetical protein [Pseudomonas aeruginosa]MBN0494507.1 hypothetical protein [Pseudomonas aeruginosa]
MLIYKGVRNRPKKGSEASGNWRPFREDRDGDQACRSDAKGLVMAMPQSPRPGRGRRARERRYRLGWPASISDKASLSSDSNAPLM